MRSYLYILDKLIRFPSDLFLEPERQTFLELAKITFTESALLIITKLTTDTGKDVLSMRRFKNWAQERIRPEYQEAFYNLLRENRFTKTTEESREKVRKIRNNLFAHLIVDKNMRPKNSLYAIPFEEMNLIANELKRLFDALCFNWRLYT